MMEQDYQSQGSIETELNELSKLDAQQKVDSTAFSYYTNEDNLVQWQLSVNEILDTLYHLLRGDKIRIKDGRRVWQDADEGKMPFTEEGVQEIIREIHIYINKNLLLSYYDAKQIPDRIYEFSTYLADVIMDNYEMVGMDTIEKQETYSLIILGVVNAVESAYNRALMGKERESLTRRTMVHQNLTPNNYQGQRQMGGGYSQKKLWNPFSWFK